MSDQTNQKSWLATLISKVATWFSGATNAAHDIAVVADNLANLIKNAEASTIGQVFETTIEMIIPASTGLVNAFKLYWPKLVTVLNLSVAETGKPDTQIAVDAANALAKMKGIDPNAFATTMAGIQANINQWLKDNQGLWGTIQQAIIQAPIVHDPTLASIINTPYIDVTKPEDTVVVQAPSVPVGITKSFTVSVVNSADGNTTKVFSTAPVEPPSTTTN